MITQSINSLTFSLSFLTISDQRGRFNKSNNKLIWERPTWSRIMISEFPLIAHYSSLLIVIIILSTNDTLGLNNSVPIIFTRTPVN